jgi:hypothetical protein
VADRRVDFDEARVLPQDQRHAGTALGRLAGRLEAVDALGVLSDINWVCNGGTFRLGKNIPLDDYHAVRLSSPLYNYAVMRVETETIDRAGFQVVARFPRATVLRRDVPVPPLR